jgi:hypothetical protein
MTEVMLQFRSADDLWAFRIEAMVVFVDMDRDRNLLICRCLQQHVRLAISKYQATAMVNKKCS